MISQIPRLFLETFVIDDCALSLIFVVHVCFRAWLAWNKTLQLQQRRFLFSKVVHFVGDSGVS